MAAAEEGPGRWKGTALRHYGAYIGGDDTRRPEASISRPTTPFQGETWAMVARCGPDDVDAAVAAAKRAFAEWSGMRPSQRGRLLRSFADLIIANAERLAEIERRDNGKLAAEVNGQVRYVGDYFHYYAGLADKVRSDVIPTDKEGVFAYTRYEPKGVVAIITPWNSPLTLTSWKLAPALAAGCTAVVKPSEFTSASMIELAALATDAGLPPGVVNVVTGYRRRGRRAAGQPCGCRPYRLHRRRGRRPQDLRAGRAGPQDGHARARREITQHRVRRRRPRPGGQRRRLGYLRRDRSKLPGGLASAGPGQDPRRVRRAADRLHPRPRSSAIRPTCPRRSARSRRSPSSTRSSPISRSPRQDGATLAYGGSARPEIGSGQFVEPTIFTDVRNDMRVAQEEIFGPVLSVIRFRDEEDAVRIGNDTIYGLAAGVWTQSLKRAMYMSDKLKAGTVYVNNYRATSFTSPFGGFKRSGIGRESGPDAIKDYLDVKTVWLSSDLDVPNPFIRR